MKFNQDTSFIVGETYCKYWVYDITKPLVVTFAPAGSLIRKDDIEKNPSIWGFDFVKQEGLNVLSFMAIERNHWYLFPEFQEFLKSLKQEISIFKIRLGYGASMGGYAISAYSNILNLDRILLYSPISTLNENILTFDKNHYIDNEAWITYSLDGAETNASGYIIYDPLYEADNKHASRYSKKLEHLRVSGVGHIVIKHIADLGMAKWIFRSFVMGKIDKETFKIKIMGLASHSI